MYCGCCPWNKCPNIRPVYQQLSSRVDLDQRNVDLTAYRGKVVLLNFWATWCAPCLTEMPRFVEWQQEYGGRGLQVIGVSMDDEAPPVRAAYQKYRLNYPVVLGRPGTAHKTPLLVSSPE